MYTFIRCISLCTCFQDDVISVNELDKVMPSGLGLRYAFLGPLETSYIGVNGTQEHVKILKFFFDMGSIRLCKCFFFFFLTSEIEFIFSDTSKVCPAHGLRQLTGEVISDVS